MHEDPKARVHRPHPFHNETVLTRHYLTPDSSSRQADCKASFSSPTTSASQGSVFISSYIAPGFYEHPLPVGKYYPTNYEQHHRVKAGQPMQSPIPTSGPSLGQDAKASSARRDAATDDKQRKMQQYQRDMIAQTTLALDCSSRLEVGHGKDAPIDGKTAREPWLLGASPHKPASPRLHPLGSPGPVTPMDLESGGGGGSSSYLDQGTKPRDWYSNKRVY